MWKRYKDVKWLNQPPNTKNCATELALVDRADADEDPHETDWEFHDSNILILASIPAMMDRKLQGTRRLCVFYHHAPETGARLCCLIGESVHSCGKSLLSSRST